MTTIVEGPATARGDGSGGGGGDAFAVGLARIAEALDGLVDVGGWVLPDAAVAERARQALAVRAGVEELASRLLAEASERGLPETLGCPSLAGWLAGEARLAPAEAARLVRRTGVVGNDRLEPTRRAWAAGQVSGEHAVAIADAIDRLPVEVPEETVAGAQRDLVGHAGTLRFGEFRTACNRLVEVVCPDAADAVLEAQLREEEKRAGQHTRFGFQRIGDGTTRLFGRLPDAQAAMLKKHLDATAAPRRDPQRRVGTAALSDHDRLPYQQRLGLALATLAEHLPTRSPGSDSGDGGLPAASTGLVVTVDLDRLRSGLGAAVAEDGTLLSAGQTRRLACTAGLVPAVLDGASRPLDLGRSRRLFSAAQKTALVIRDRGCIWPDCDRPASWCEAHHLSSWVDGGPTDLVNGCLLCPYHHQQAHTDDWQVRLGSDGVPEVIPPARLDPHRRPRRNHRYQPPD